MLPSEKKDFVILLKATLEVFGQSLSEAAVSVWWASLEGYDLDAVKGGFSAHITDPERGRYAPKPADIIAKIPTGHPSPEEAWSMVHQALGDEGATLVLTEPMRTAFWAADALAGDKIAARMAFLEVYRREVASAPAPRWGVIAGWDMQRRQDVIDKAVSAGRLSLAAARQFLPPPGDAQNDARLVTRYLKSA